MERDQLPYYAPPCSTESACPIWSVRERERERQAGREREIARDGGRGREGGGESERENDMIIATHTVFIRISLPDIHS